MTLLCVIYGAAIFFWLRYLFLHTFRKRTDFIYFTGKLVRVLILLPLGFQAIVLFLFSLIELLQLAQGFSAAVTAGSAEIFYIFSPVSYPVYVLVIGSAVVTVNYVFIKMAAELPHQFTRGLVTLLLCIFGIGCSRILLSNVTNAALFGIQARILISYQSGIWCAIVFVMLCVFATLKHGRYVKYFALNLLILITYALIILLLALPLIILRLV